MSIALMALAAVALAACDDRPAAAVADVGARHVRVSTVQTLRQTREVRFSAVTRASQRATLAFLISGTLTQRPVELGDEVAAGQAIARLYNPTIEPAVAASDARVRELEARVVQLQRDVARAADLRDRNLISQDDLEQVRTDLDAMRANRDLAAANLAETRNQLAQAELVAPFAASVQATFFEPGEFVAAGQPVIQLSNTERLEVEFEIPETLITHFSAGAAVTLSLPFLDQREISGRVVHVGDAGGRSGGLFPVEIAIDPGPDLRPGLSVELLLELPSTLKLIVPLAAVLDPGTGQPQVYRVADGRIDPVRVRVGQLFRDRVEVVGPLSDGDQLVVTGLSSLTPGQRVQVLP